MVIIVFFVSLGVVVVHIWNGIVNTPFDDAPLYSQYDDDSLYGRGHYYTAFPKAMTKVALICLCLSLSALLFVIISRPAIFSQPTSQWPCYRDDGTRLSYIYLDGKGYSLDNSTSSYYIIKSVDNKYWEYITNSLYSYKRVLAKNTTVYCGDVLWPRLYKIYKRPAYSSIKKIYRLLFLPMITQAYDITVDRYIFYVPRGSIYEGGIIR